MAPVFLASRPETPWAAQGKAATAENIRTMKRRLLAMSLLGLLAVPPVSAGEITGQVTIGSTPVRRAVGKKRVSYAYEGEHGEVPKPKESEVEDVVIYLQGANLPSTVLTSMVPKNTISEHNKEFLPHVLPLVKGSKVYFRNQDGFPHHVYSVSNPGSFEIEKHGNTVRNTTFEAAGEVEIFCGIHTKMNAYILVLDNDCYGTPNAEGKYRIGKVPAGQYTLVVWHPRLPKPEKQMITVPASGSLSLNLKL